LNFTPTQQQIALTFLSGIGSRRARVIIRHFNDLNEFFSEKKLNLAKIPGIQADFISHKQRMLALEAAKKVDDALQQLGGETVFFTEAHYPRRLKQCADAPLLLYAKGKIDWNPEKIISIVGTRNASDYGKQLTEEFMQEIAKTGTTVVSGMAYGIDILAHKAAVKLQLPTIGVLGHGLDTLYPSAHRKTAQQMIENGGLITEFAPGMKPEPAYFPMRNRIVAGIADATIVIESGIKGGSLITANLANDYNRDVFAFPGDVTRPYSAGCLKLIQQNKAHLITNTADLLEVMSWKDAEKPNTVQRNLFVDLTTDEERIIETLTTKKEMTIDVIGYLTTFTVGQTAALLLNLEFKGLIKSLPGKRYALI